MDNNIKLTQKDFKSDQEIRWCPGCGDIAIFAAITKALPELDHKHENYAFISGIGCSSRFPYYINTYGVHSIHGRAAAIASGVKVANPNLSVWEITGDGDAMAIGGNHFIHAIRRNVDFNLILFNNQIYGLTKGQYSPTSQFGQVTKTSPYGTIERPFNPGELTIGSQGTFFARGIDTNVKMCTDLMLEAEKHRGLSVVEVLQNCVIFNDNAYGYLTDKENRDDRQILLQHGKPMLFGKNQDKGLVLDGLKLKVVKLGENGISEKDILVHDVTTKDSTLHEMLVRMEGPDFPVAFGVIRAVAKATYNDLVDAQIAEVQSKTKIKCMDDLLRSGSTWEVK